MMVANNQLRLSQALGLLASLLLVALGHAQGSEISSRALAERQIYSSQYTVSFPLTSTFTVIRPSPTISSTPESSSQASTTSQSASSLSTSSSAAQVGA